MKKIKINVPEGYEIDKDKSSFEEIVFKKKKELPKTWKELGCVKGYFVFPDSRISTCSKFYDKNINKNVFPSRETAKAGGILLPMLLQLRDRYRDGWRPDWNNSDEPKYVIVSNSDDDLAAEAYYISKVIFSFQSKEIAQQFLDNFGDMLEEYFNALTE